ncbi:hypothetical protein KKD70_02595, partial [Patescibacteria group bacterium]|nr:hypothetical protein [Patescibacteria group bacterium]
QKRFMIGLLFSTTHAAENLQFYRFGLKKITYPPFHFPRARAITSSRVIIFSFLRDETCQPSRKFRAVFLGLKN